MTCTRNFNFDDWQCPTAQTSTAKCCKNSKETNIVLYSLLQKYDAIISKSDNDISKTDLIKMHIATKPNAAPITAQL